MKIAFIGLAILGSLLTSPPSVYAQSANVVKVQSFFQQIILILVSFSGLLAVIFFIWGGVGYITSSGNPMALDRSKRTIMYSAIGLVISLGAFLLSTILTEVATNAFGKM